MGNLIAVHNEQISNFQKVLELGGWPAPSIAITNSDFDYNKFGEISFLFNAESVDPSQNSNNLIYEADAYSARFPKILYRFDADKINKMFGADFRVSCFNSSISFIAGFGHLVYYIWFKIKTQALMFVH